MPDSILRSENNHNKRTNMKQGKSYLFYSLLAVTSLSLASCSEDDDPPAVIPKLQVKEVVDLNADKAANDSHYVFFSLVDGQTVPATDSACNKWAIAFVGTSIILKNQKQVV